MRFDVITLFPELFEPFFAHGINRRAFESKQVDVRLWNPRDFANGNYRRGDDRPFGGGPGMVMMAEPLWRCLQAIRAERAEPQGARAPVVLFSPHLATRQAAAGKPPATQPPLPLLRHRAGVGPPRTTLHSNLQRG